MNAIVVRRQLSKPEFHQIRELLGKGDWIIYSDLDIDFHGDTRKEIHLEENRKRHLNYKLMDLLKDFPEKRVADKSLIEALDFDKANLWYYHKYRVYFDSQQTLYQFYSLNEYAQGHDKVYCYSNPIPAVVVNNLPSSIRIIECKKSTRNGLKKIMYLLRYVFLVLSRALLQIRIPSIKNRPDHVVMDLSMWQHYLNRRTLKTEFDNYIFGYLFDILDNGFLVINESIQPNQKVKHNLKKIHPLRKDYGLLFSENIMLKGYMNPSVLIKSFRTVNQVKARISDIDASAYSFEEQFIFKSLQRNIGSSIYYILRYGAYDGFFKKHRFKTITTTDENSPGTRSILDAARKNGITTIGVQHGNIHELHPAYVFSKNDTKRGAMVDHTLVWGEYYKELLVNTCHYNPSDIAITGQMRTDIIPSLIKSVKGEDHPGEGNVKTIVFASQPQQDPALRKRAAEDVFMGLKNLAGIRLIIKLHPAEKDPDYYSEIAGQVGFGHFDFAGSIDLYELINRSFVVITCFSTVGMEVSYFKKPLIILDHLRQDIQNYCKEGIGIQVTDSNELGKAVEEFLKGSRAIDEKSYESFIKKYAYRIDGKVTERTKKFILSFSQTLQ
jgi:hypothetical protein